VGPQTSAMLVSQYHHVRLAGPLALVVCVCALVV